MAGTKVTPSPGERIKARKARKEEWWTGKRGNQGIYVPGLDKELRKKRPHSSPEGRMRDVPAHMKKKELGKKFSDLTKNRPVPKMSSGGKATRGYGKAYMKGGRAK